MSDQEFKLTNVFPPVLAERWQELVESDLKGASIEKKLVTHTYEGLDIQPLYTAADRLDAPDSGQPGQAPYTRGLTPLKPGNVSWEIRQDLLHPDPSEVRRAAKDDLDHGVDSLILRLDPTGAKGVIAPTVEAIEECLADVDLRTIPIAIEGGPHFTAVADMMHELWQRRGVDCTEVRGTFLADPFTPLLGKGKLPVPIDTLLDELGALAVRCKNETPGVTAAKVSTCPLHNAGASADQELAMALSTGLSYLKAMTKAGLTLEEAAGQIQFCFSTGGTFFLDIAKLRAARMLWARLLEASGANPAAVGMILHARTSVRMLTQRDPWVNMLRATAGTFAAAVGGAGIVTVTPFDHQLGPANEFSRRIARNVQIVLQEESHLGWVSDPAGGSYFLESLTDGLCEKGWAMFQEIEGRGGMATVLTEGWLQDKVGEVWAARLRHLAKRKDAITGVSEYPNLSEKLPDVPQPDRAELQKRWGAPGRLSRPGGEPVTASPLKEQRLAAPFETLRDASDAHQAATGSRPRIFQANLGPVAHHTARAAWSRNVFEAGGFEVLASDPCDGADAVAASFRSSGAAVAVLCSSDKLYAEHGPAAVKALKDAGATMVVLAGRFGDMEPEWREAGVDLAVHVGCDILQFLRTLLRHEGVEA